MTQPACRQPTSARLTRLNTLLFASGGSSSFWPVLPRRSSPLFPKRKAAQNAKAEKLPGRALGLFRHRSFGHPALERLVGLFGEIDIKLAELGRFGDEILIRGF